MDDEDGRYLFDDFLGEKGLQYLLAFYETIKGFKSQLRDTPGYADIDMNFNNCDQDVLNIREEKFEWYQRVLKGINRKFINANSKNRQDGNQLKQECHGRPLLDTQKCNIIIKIVMTLNFTDRVL